jgi:hypothetical protein
MDMEETNSTVMLADGNGGLAPAIKTRELRKRAASDTVETEKTTWLLDVNRNWQVNEVRHATTRQEGTNRTTEERLSRLDSQGKLREVSHVVVRNLRALPRKNAASWKPIPLMSRVPAPTAACTS